MGLMLALLVLHVAPRQAVPKRHASPEQMQQHADQMRKTSEANNKFRKLIDGSKSFSVDFSIKQSGNPELGHANLVVVHPDKLYFHVDFGSDKYTYVIANGTATEVDYANKVYDTYDVPGLGAPEANGSDWVASYFPSMFVSSETELPPDCFDDAGHITKYSIKSDVGDKTVNNLLTFSNYIINPSVPDSKFILNAPAGMTAYSTPRLAPPLQIGETLPPLELRDASGQSQSLLHALGGKRTLVALLDPQSAPSLHALQALKEVK